MTSQASQHVWNACYKNAAVGLEATNAILPEAADPQLRKTLCQQLTYYQEQKDSLRQQMQQLGITPEEQGTMAKFCVDASIRLHCTGKTSTSEIAKLMIKGTNEGVMQLTQVLHSEESIPEQLRHQGEEIVRREEAYTERLKAYL